MSTFAKTTKFHNCYTWKNESTYGDLHDKLKDCLTSSPDVVEHDTKSVGNLASVLLQELRLAIVPVPRAHVTEFTKKALTDIRDLLLIAKKRWDYLGWDNTKSYTRDCCSTLFVEVEFETSRSASRYNVKFQLWYKSRQSRWHDPSIYISKQEIQEYIVALLVVHSSEDWDKRKVVKTTMEQCWILANAKVTINNQICMSLI